MDRFDSQKNVFFKEWTKDHQQRAPVGPGYYDINSADPHLAKKPVIISFPKNNRGLVPIQKVEDSPGPSSYDTLPEPYFLLSRNLKSTAQFLK